MKFVSPETMRDMDRAAIDAGTPERELMDRAGRAIATELLAMDPKRVLFLAGPGNNGGDAFAAARYLQEAGVRCQVWSTTGRSDYGPTSAEHLTAAAESGVPMRFLETEHAWSEAGGLPLVDVAVDCLLGTGASGAPRGNVAHAIHRLNALPATIRIVAVDSPSGLDAGSGEIHEPCVHADRTLTLGLPKMAFLKASAREVTGSIECLDIGLGSGPDNNPDLQMIGPPAASRRRVDSHKNTFGHVLCIGGAAGYSGAIGLAARAALRSGAGLVTVAPPISQAAVVSVACPEAMVKGMPETETGSLSLDAWDTFEHHLQPYSAVLIGPGMTQHEDTLQLARRCLRDVEVPTVFDADALNVFHGRAHWFAKSRGPVVMTPHPGELARMLAEDTADIQADRFQAAKQCVGQTDGILVLKGSGTLVMSREEGWINLNGNPALATAGSGDVLAGMLAGLIAQGRSPMGAAKEAVYRHARAGDRAAWQAGSGVLAGDLLPLL